MALSFRVFPGRFFAAGMVVELDLRSCFVLMARDLNGCRSGWIT
jgi:hypothetical protein